LLQYLIRIQAEYSYISDQALSLLSSALDIPLSEVRSVVDFYSFLHLNPRGQYDILFSDSITDHMLGSHELHDDLCQKLGVTSGTPREDGRVTVDMTSCTGMCEQGPALLVNGLAISHLNKQRIEQIAELIEGNVNLNEWPEALFTVNDNIQRQDILLDSLPDNTDNTSTLDQLLSHSAEDVLHTLQDANLRGRGGAGFMTDIKWRSCKETASEQRYVICNADEGEPGTFKDRVLLQSYANRLIDGMTLCASVINATKGFIYLRGEYLYLLEHLETLLQERREHNLLGDNILGKGDFNFDIQIHLGAGAYICGEESALIESLEGKRGIPRVRPPFPVSSGYLGHPTVVNNVETFIAAAMIMINGSDWFRSTGTKESTGTKLLSVCGDCQQPGIYEYPFGTTIRQILSDCDARNTQAVQVGGPAGEMISPAEFDRCIAYEDIATGGSFMIFNEQRDLLEVVANFAAFFVHESCGFCTPCRVGTSLIQKRMKKMLASNATCDDTKTIHTIGLLMRNTSHCGLGATAANPIMDLMKKFPAIYQHRLRSTSFEPGFNLDKALEEARQLTNRDDPAAHLKNGGV
jgi:[NiFe] hydrogenase diaphorase moiety large subunit